MKEKNNIWVESELLFLKNNFDRNYEQCLKYCNKRHDEIIKKAKQLKLLARTKKLTNKELEFIINNYNKQKTEKLAIKLKMSNCAVREFANKHNLKKNLNSPTKRKGDLPVLKRKWSKL